MSNENQSYRKKGMPTWLSILLIRWWSAGAVYYFIGWGTMMGHNSTLVDLIFFLGVVMGLINAFVLNPIFKQLFDYGWHKTYKQSTVVNRFFSRLIEIFLSLLTITLVSGVYTLINRTIISMRNIDLTVEGNRIPLPVEPLLFGLFYALIGQTIMFVILKLLKRRT